MKDGHFFIRLESARGIAALTVAAMHSMTVFSPKEEADLLSLTFWRVVANMLLLDVSMNGLMWSLQVEITAIPLIILLGYAEHRLGIVSLAIATAALFGLIFTSRWSIGSLSLAPLFGFALGMIARHWKLIVANLNTFVVAAIFIASVVAFEITRVLLPPSTAGYRWITIVECISSSIFIASIAFSLDKPLHFFEHPILRFYGRISYSLYLIHPMVLIWLEIYIQRALSLPAALTMILVVLSLSTALAWMLWALVEKPGITLGRAVTR